MQILKSASFVLGFSLLLLSPATSVNAQTATPKNLDAAVMLDEYGSIGGCDHSARLDNFAIQLQNDSNLEGYLVYYGPESASERTLDIIKDYLVNSRGVADERWRTIYAGPNSDPREPRIQLWLAPRGTPPPELTKYENKTDNFSGLFDQHERWDSIAYGEGGTGPPVPDVSLPSFIDILKKQQDSVAYVVAFNGSDAAPGAWRRVAQLESEEFASGGVEPGRVKIIYGGPDKETKIQLWILPKTAPPPVMDAGLEPLPEKTIQIGSFSDYDVAEERGERWAFKGFVDVLRSKDDLRACIIVRLESDDSQENSESEPAEELISQEVTAGPPESVEIPRADILKLIEKWRSELAETYKIREDRFIVLFATPPKYSGNSLETWIVPSGAPLPDPNAEPTEAAPEEPVEPATGEGVIQPDDVKSDKIGIDQTQPDKPRKSNPPQLLLPNT